MKLPNYSNLFFESLPEAAYVLSSDYSLLYINDAACRYHKLSKENALGKRCYELYCEAQSCQNCPVDEVIETGCSIEKEIFREGERSWHLIRVFPIEEHGKITKVGTITKDITSTKTAEQILVDFNFKIKNFIDRMPIGCILWDEEFKVSLWNPAAEQIFGYTEKEARGKHPYSIIVPPDLIPETESVKQNLQKGHDSAHRTGENTTKDGRRIYCSWINTPVRDAEGDVIAILSMVQDITLERQLQNEAIRSAQLASIGQLAASIAHEINNPIGGVINYSQILLNKKGNLEESQVNILEKIQKEGERIAEIVKSLLNFARKPSENIVPQDVYLIIDEAISLLTPEIKKSGVEISFDPSLDDPMLKCNPQQIGQVVINILKNAIDALNESNRTGKKIHISLTKQLKGNRREFILSIANNGPHIPAHLQEKIFDPFMTTKDQGLGTGLGLGISLEIMKNHGGTIKLNSKQGQLTEMELIFPL